MNVFLKEFVKLIFTNLFILFSFVVLVELFFGYWFDKDNFGPFMREHRMKNQRIEWTNKEEKIIAEKIKNLSPKVNICDRMTLSSLIALFSKVDLVIGPDTGPTHIAWALNVPSITLFGPTPGYRNTYQTKINKVIESKSKVNPSKINKSDFSIKDIEVNDIVKISHQLLKAIE